MRKIGLYFLLFVPAWLCLNCSRNNNDQRNIEFPSEQKEIKDRTTGVTIRQLTNYKGHSHHFYFTNPGWFDGGQKLLFSSDRNNRTNLFSIDLRNNSLKQLTNLEPVPLPREVEFFRACKNPVKEEAYFWHDLELIALDLESLHQSTIFKLD